MDMRIEIHELKKKIESMAINECKLKKTLRNKDKDIESILSN